MKILLVIQFITINHADNPQIIGIFDSYKIMKKHFDFIKEKMKQIINEKYIFEFAGEFDYMSKEEDEIKVDGYNFYIPSNFDDYIVFFKEFEGIIE